MEEISKSLKPIFDKLSDFFNLFDLSFFVSGSLSTGFVYLWMNFKNITPPIIQLNKYTVFIILLSCYIMGLFCFALGRFIRKEIMTIPSKIFRKIMNLDIDPLDEKILNILNDHNLTNNALINPYLNINNPPTEKRLWRLYVRLWGEIRDKEKYSKSFSFLNRYWVMSATYDGLIASLIIACFLLLDLNLNNLPSFNIEFNSTFNFFWSFQITLIFLIYICYREANRYFDYQIEEVICTIACFENTPPQNPPAQPVVPIPNGIPPTLHTTTTTTTTTITVP